MGKKAELKAAVKHARLEALAIVLKGNNVQCGDVCALCGKEADQIGVDYFLEGTWRAVCEACALKKQPALVMARRLYNVTQQTDDMPF